MACEAPPRECLHQHIRPKAPGAWDDIRQDGETKRWYFMARCPCHDDTKPSLKISEGKLKRIVWWCYAGCGDRKIRHALIELGVHPECLPRAAPELRDLEETLRGLLTSDLGHADVRLRALALLDSPGGDLPRGGELVRLAAAAHVSRSEAFSARRAGTSQTTR